MAPCFIKDDNIVNEKVLFESDMFLGTDSLFDGLDNVTYFINRDSSGFYVFSMESGNLVVKWVRRDRMTDNNAFRPTYTADVVFAGDRINKYKMEKGLYVDMGTGKVEDWMQDYLLCEKCWDLKKGSLTRRTTTG